MQGGYYTHSCLGWSVAGAVTWGFEPEYRAQQMAPLAWALRKAGQWRPVSFPCGPPGGSCCCHLVRSAVHLGFQVLLTSKDKWDQETTNQAWLGRTHH